MRKWGVVISAFYALILLVLLLPVFVLLAQSQYHGLPQFLRDLAEAYRGVGDLGGLRRPLLGPSTASLSLG